MNTNPKLAPKPKVLWIDNNPNSMQLTAKILSEDFDVKTALSDPKSIDVLHSFAPDAIVVDVDLPNLYSITICRLIRAEPDFFHTPILFLSQVGSTDERFKAFQAGGDDFIQKPINESLLKDRINQSLMRAQKNGTTTQSTAQKHPELEENIQTLHEYLLGLISMDNDQAIGEFTLDVINKLGLKGALRWHFNGEIYSSIGPLSDLETALLQQAKQTFPRGYSARDLWGSESIGVIVHNMPSQKSNQYQTMYQLLTTIFNAVDKTINNLTPQRVTSRPLSKAFSGGVQTDQISHAAASAHYLKLRACLEAIEDESEKYLGNLSTTLQAQAGQDKNEQNRQLYHKLLNQCIQARISIYDQCLEAQTELNSIKAKVVDPQKQPTPA